MNILVIEDSLFYQKIYENFFASIGAKYTIVDQGVHGLDALEQSDFDFIFVDINLPDISGWEVIKELHSESPDFRIIPVTGYNIETAEEAFRKINPDQFLIKPFNSNDLAEIIGNEHNTTSNGGLNMSDHTSNQEQKTKDDLKKFCESMGLEVASPLLELFLKEVQSKVPSFRSLVEQEHFSEIENSVHQLKSNCRYFGFMEYADICDQIEQLIVSGSTDEVPHLVDCLVDRSDSLLEISNQVLKEIGSAAA